jgi:hypothetical protein
MVYLTRSINAAFSFLAIIKDRNAFFNYSVKIKAFFIAFPAFRLILANSVNKFSVVYSASVRSLV